MPAPDDLLAHRFTEHRAHLLGVAYRLTGLLADAEDAVQEAWLRLSRLDEAALAGIEDLRAWLTTVVGRICLDRLRSAAARRERYVGPWLPEPLVTPIAGTQGEDPLDVVVRDDGVRMAALAVLHRLSPEQRVAFVLHDGLGLPFAEIAEVLGCSVATARQHASRGRRAVAEGDPPPRAALAEQQQVVESFLTALSHGDVPAVVRLLHPDVVVMGDGGGRVRTTLRAVAGAEKVARFVFGLWEKYYGIAGFANARPVLVNGDFGVVVPPIVDAGGRETAARRVLTFAVRDGRLAAVFDVANPDKLTRVPW
ncbi:RNA polymerase sigma-70 factor, ECF subfamily [Streptoalloteichus tenebrarius]|uniref:RNA polymerase sigma-70 factor, ECF subfamily n=2 Tax=Actinomycetes TaxID=1760 RepID=A0ABT1I3T0_STRSD|nr:RNA polymerase sigma factor SigJ [Streptoalloteichus tenebrarius]MCP2262447.1 RNA polymerase sigma-70 factor, ECF subfamily [Streptoalloteichus tenebrarius]BFF00431.1 sigma-70 family RNA polymerase sigma factor [Streptoalloteichus tenebrarius]